MQGVTHIAPAVGLVLSLQFVVVMAGAASPLAFAIALLIVLLLGVCLCQLARHLPSAGGYYTYISHTLHPRAGFLTAWMFFLYDPLTAAVNLAFMGFLLQATLRLEAGLNCPWYVIFLAAALFITVLTYRGIEISAGIMVGLTVIEILIIGALALASLAHPGDGGLQVQSFTALHNFRHKGLYLAIVFAIFSFTGFESVAPLAEETRDPRRVLPRAILLSIALMGIFFVGGSWAVLTGWGSNHIEGFANSAENPIFVLAKRLWGGAWVFVVIAVVNSILGASIAGTNASTRVFFAMGRARSLPSALASIHPRFRTPVNAILLQTFITLAIGLGVGFWIGPDQEYYFLGVAMTLGLLCIYAAGNVGVFVYYRNRRRAEFNVWFHLIFPLLSTLSLVWVFYRSVVPLPDPPLRYAPLLVAAWLLAGLLLLCTGRGASLVPLGPLALAPAAGAAPSGVNSRHG
jgi:amino acid transporter